MPRPLILKLTPLLDLKLLHDNANHWNSAYNSVERVLRIREPLQMLCVEQRTALGKDHLANDDRLYLENVHEGLQSSESSARSKTSLQHARTD